MIAINGLEPKQYRITANGIQDLQRQLANLQQRRREIVGEVTDLVSQTTDVGATTEDSTYAANQNQLADLDNQIKLLERIIGMAEVIDKPASNDEVRIGSRVTLNVDGQERTYTVVGPVEADPNDGNISYESPLGKALLGKKANDKFELPSPAHQQTSITVLRIE